MSGSVTTIPKRPGVDMIHRQAKMEYPADLLKFIAWPNVVGSFEEAVNMIIDKKPVLGEPIIVPFEYQHLDGTKTVEVVLGIGSLDQNHPFIKCSVTNDILNEGLIQDVQRDEHGEPLYDDEGQPLYTYAKLETLLKEFIKKDDANQYISSVVNESLTDPDLLNTIAERLVDSGRLQAVINERLSWKPISDLL